MNDPVKHHYVPEVLDNMQWHLHDNLEYYSSFEYLRVLLGKARY